MDGGLAHHARKCLMQRERVRTGAGLATADQFPDGIDQPFLKEALIYSALLPAMDGGLAHHARQCLMQPERVRTAAGLATAD